MRSQKNRAARFVELDDFAIDYGVVSVYFEGKLRGQVLESAILKVSPRDEFCTPAVNVGQRTKAVVLQLEEPVRMVERFGPSAERHRSIRNCHRRTKLMEPS
jgi:hypothetical protein